MNPVFRNVDGNIIHESGEIPDDNEKHLVTFIDKNDCKSSFSIYAERKGDDLIWSLIEEGKHVNIPFPKLASFIDEQAHIPDTALQFKGEVSKISSNNDFYAITSVIDNAMTLKTLVITSDSIAKGAITGKKKVVRISKKYSLYDTKEKLFSAVWGDFQSGKSAMINNMAKYLTFVYNMLVLVVVRNVRDDREQLRDRMRTSNLGPELKEYNIVEDMVYNKGNTDIEDIIGGMTGKKHCIYIALRNDTDLGFFNSLLDKVYSIIGWETFRLFIIMDEADCIDTRNNGECKAQTFLDKIIEKSSGLISVSATQLSHLFHRTVKSENMIKLTPPSNYKGLDACVYISLDKPATSSSKKNDDLFSIDSNLEERIEEFVRSEPYSDNARIFLFRCSTAVEPQGRMVSYVNKKYGDKVVAISYNGDGIRMRGHVLPKKSFLVGKKFSKYEKGEHGFLNISIGEVIAWLHINLGVERCPRIFIFSGVLAGRSISFCGANYNRCLERGDRVWHITDMYVIVSKTTTQSDLLQIAGRICGVFPDGFPRRIYSNDPDSIIKSYYLQLELGSRALERDGEMSQLISETTIHKNKNPKRPFSKHTRKCPGKIVSTDDRGWDTGIVRPEDIKPEKKKRKKAEKKEDRWNDGDVLRISLNDLADGTIYKRICLLTIGILTEKKMTGIWVTRSKITNLLLAKEPSYTKSQINGHFSNVCNDHSDKTDYVTESEKGLLFTMKNKKWQVRLNSSL